MAAPSELTSVPETADLQVQHPLAARVKSNVAEDRLFDAIIVSHRRLSHATPTATSSASGSQDLSSAELVVQQATVSPKASRTSGELVQQSQLQPVMQKSFACKLCSYNSVCKVNVKRHLIYKHSDIEKRFRCPDCDYSSHERSNLNRHIRAKHTNDRPFKCGKCSYAAVERRTLRSHMRQKHGEDDSSSPPHRCSACEHETHSSEQLLDHIRTCHPDQWALRCTKCDFVAESRPVLHKHLASEHDSVELNSKAVSAQANPKPLLHVINQQHSSRPAHPQIHHPPRPVFLESRRAPSLPTLEPADPELAGTSAIPLQHRRGPELGSPVPLSGGKRKSPMMGGPEDEDEEPKAAERGSAMDYGDKLEEVMFPGAKKFRELALKRTAHIHHEPNLLFRCIISRSHEEQAAALVAADPVLAGSALAPLPLAVTASSDPKLTAGCSQAVEVFNLVNQYTNPNRELQEFLGSSGGFGPPPMLSRSTNPQIQSFFGAILRQHQTQLLLGAGESSLPFQQQPPQQLRRSDTPVSPRPNLPHR